MPAISMPTTFVIQGFDALLKVLQRNSLKNSCDGVAYARIDLSIPESSRRFYEERLKHTVLRDCMENREVLGAELYDGHWVSVVARDPPSQTELSCIIHCKLEGRGGSTGQKYRPS